VEVDLALGGLAVHPSGSIAHVRYTVLAVGRVRTPYADDVEHYQRLLTRQARVDVIEVREDEQVERRIPDRSYVSLLDAGGETYTSEGFARWLEALLDVVRAEPHWAALGSCLLLDGSDGLLDGTGDVYHVSGLHWREGHMPPDSPIYDRPREIFSPCAAAAMYQASAR